MIHNPKHPGLLVKRFCIEPLGISVTTAAKAMRISRTALSKILNGRANITPEMAERLAIVFNSSDELWLNLQTQYDLWEARQSRQKLRLKPLSLFQLTAVAT